MNEFHATVYADPTETAADVEQRARSLAEDFFRDLDYDIRYDVTAEFVLSGRLLHYRVHVYACTVE